MLKNNKQLYGVHMKRIIYLLVIGAVITTQAYAQEEAVSPTDKPAFKKCEKCFELRKKAREERMAERKARKEKLKENKAEEKEVKFEKKEWKGPIFCDECKEKFKDKKPEQWRKHRKNRKEAEFKDSECKCCEHCKKGKGKGKFAPKKDKAPAVETPAEVE